MNFANRLLESSLDIINRSISFQEFFTSTAMLVSSCSYPLSRFSLFRSCRKIHTPMCSLGPFQFFSSKGFSCANINAPRSYFFLRFSSKLLHSLSVNLVISISLSCSISKLFLSFCLLRVKSVDIPLNFMLLHHQSDSTADDGVTAVNKRN